MKNFCFIRLTSTTGKALVDCIINRFSQLGFDLNFSRGKNMMEPSTWMVHTEVCRQKYLCCIHHQCIYIYMHCCSHVRNVVVSGASQLPSIRNAVGTVASVCVFISWSAQQTAILQKFVQTRTPTSRRRNQLIPLYAKLSG